MWSSMTGERFVAGGEHGMALAAGDHRLLAVGLTYENDELWAAVRSGDDVAAFFLAKGQGTSGYVGRSRGVHVGLRRTAFCCVTLEAADWQEVVWVRLGFAPSILPVGGGDAVAERLPGEPSFDYDLAPDQEVAGGEELIVTPEVRYWPVYSQYADLETPASEEEIEKARESPTQFALLIVKVPEHADRTISGLTASIVCRHAEGGPLSKQTAMWLGKARREPHFAPTPSPEPISLAPGQQRKLIVVVRLEVDDLDVCWSFGEENLRRPGWKGFSDLPGQDFWLQVRFSDAARGRLGDYWFRLLNIRGSLWFDRRAPKVPAFAGKLCD